MNLSRKAEKRDRSIIIKGTDLTVKLDYFNRKAEVIDNEGNKIKETDTRYPVELLELENNTPSNLSAEFNDFFKAVKLRGVPENNAEDLLWISQCTKEIMNLPADSYTVLPQLSSPHLRKMLPLDKVKKMIRGEEIDAYPAKVEFYVGLSCPKRCFFCYRSEGQGEKLNTYHEERKAGLNLLKAENYRNIVNESARKGTEFFYVSGGLEPLTDIESVKAIIDEVSKFGKKSVLMTSGDNGSWREALPEEFLDLVPYILKTAKFRISLHAATWEVYRDMMNCRNPEEVYYNTIARLRKVVEEKRKTGSKTEISISMLMTPVNYHEVLELADLAKDIGLDTLNLSVDYTDLVEYFSDEDESKLINLLTELNKRRNNGYYKGLNITFPDCFVVFNNHVLKTQFYSDKENYSDRGIYPFEITIGPYGKVYNTTTAANPGLRNQKWGREQNLDRISGEKPLELREVINSHIKKDTRFNYESTNPLIRQMLTYIKRIEQSMEQDSSDEKLLQIAAEVEKAPISDEFRSFLNFQLAKVNSSEELKFDELIIDNIGSGLQVVSFKLQGVPGKVFINNIFPGHYDFYVGKSFKESFFAASVTFSMNRETQSPENVNIHMKENWHYSLDYLSDENIIFFRKILADLFQEDYRKETINKADRNLHDFHYFRTGEKLKSFHPSPQELLSYFAENGIEVWSEESDELLLIIDYNNKKAVEIFKKLEKNGENSGFLAILNRHNKLRLRGMDVKDHEICLELYSPETLSKDSLEKFWQDLYRQLKNYSETKAEELFTQSS